MVMRRHSTATLMGLTKKELVEYVRMAEHNQEVAEETLNQQAENVKDWKPVVHGRWKESKNLDECFWVCSNCKFTSEALAAPKIYNYCPNCGADMR